MARNALLAFSILLLAPLPGEAAGVPTEAPLLEPETPPATRTAQALLAEPAPCRGDRGQPMDPIQLRLCLRAAEPPEVAVPTEETRDSPLSPSSRIPLCAPVQELDDDRCETWQAVYNHPGGGRYGLEVPADIAANPDNSLVYVTGWSRDQETGNDYATVAYDQASGRQVWVARYNGPGNEEDYAQAVAVSPDGSTVFVTGTGAGTTGYDVALVAYDAATGQERWVSAYGHESGGSDEGWDIAVSGDGSRVYSGGVSCDPDAGVDFGTSGDCDFLAVGHDAATGKIVWASRSNETPDDQPGLELAYSRPSGNS